MAGQQTNGQQARHRPAGRVRKECRFGGARLIGIAASVVMVSSSAGAQSVENFYRGKTINFVIGYPTAGAPDIYARLVVRHLGKHIPGKPALIARNMPGAGSLLAANHLFNVAPRDGTTL